MREEIRLASIEDLLKYIKPNSVDLILTDPPYLKEYLFLWSVLAEKASIVLKEGGFLVAYSGQIWLPEILDMIKEYLTYVWTFALIMPAGQARIWMQHIFQGWKPILVFAKRPYNMKWQPDILESPRRIKGDHRWQQNIEPVKILIENFSSEGDFVVDPFLGSGTTVVAARQLGRSYFGMDVDKVAITTALQRLSAVGQPLY